jgi:uncharacterized protein
VFGLSDLSVTVGGNNVTGLFSNILKGVTVTLHEDGKSNTADITMADVGGWVRMPQKNADVTISILGSQVFCGVVDDVETSVDASSGRQLSVTCKALDTRGKAKQKMSAHLDDKTFKEAAQEFGKKADMTDVKVSDSLASIKRKYWSMNNESFIHWGRRIAKELGAIFQVECNKALFAVKNEGKSVSGKPLTTIFALSYVNLISARMRPLGGRPRAKKKKVRYFDRKTGKYKEAEVEVEDDSAKTEQTSLDEATDEDGAKAKAKSGKADTEADRGNGDITILGNPAAMPGANVILTGARPGADGVYKIKTVTHRVSSGFQTDLSVNNPTGSSGVDSR